MSDRCVFCAIISRQETASRVYEDGSTLAFMKLRQANPGHVLVVPKAHVATMDRLSLQDGAALGETVVRVSRAIRECFEPEGLSLWQSNGEVAGKRYFMCMSICFRDEHRTDTSTFTQHCLQRNQDSSLKH